MVVAFRKKNGSMSDPTPKVSVIIPVYNSEKTVGEALDSAAAPISTISPDLHEINVEKTGGLW